MKACPFCNKENNDSAVKCSCGYYFDKKLYEEKSKQEHKQELLNNKLIRSNKIWIFIVPILVLISGRLIKESFNNSVHKLEYSISSKYVRIPHNEMKKILISYGIDNSSVENLDIVLYSMRNNMDEQLLVFENPFNIINNQNDINKYFDGISKTLKTHKIDGAEFNEPEQGIITLENEFKVHYLKTLVNYSNGDYRYTIYNIIKFKNKYFQVLLYTYNSDKSLDEILTIY